MFGERDHVLEELKARAAEPIPQGGDQKGPRRLSPDRAPANSIDRKAQAMAGAS